MAAVEPTSRRAATIQKLLRRVASRISRPATRPSARAARHGASRAGDGRRRVGRRPSAGASPAAARNSSDRPGASTAKSATGAVGPHGVEHLAGVGARVQAQPGAGGVAWSTTVGRAARRATPASTATSTTQVAVGAGRLQGPHVALQHHAAAVDQRDRLAEVLDQVELVAGEQEVPPGARRGRGSRSTGTRRPPGRGRRRARRAPAARGRAPSPRPAAPAGPCRPRGPAPCRRPVGQAEALQQVAGPGPCRVARSRPCSRAIQTSRSSTRMSR